MLNVTHVLFVFECLCICLDVFQPQVWPSFTATKPHSLLSSILTRHVSFLTNTPPSSQQTATVMEIAELNFKKQAKIM